MSGALRRFWGKGLHDPVILELTDGRESIDLLEGRDGFFMEEWRPGSLSFKGGGQFRDSPMADGRQIAHYVYANITDVVKGYIAGSSPNAAIATSRRIRQMLVKSTTTNVWLVGQGRGETMVRYAPVVMGRIPGDANVNGTTWSQRDGRSTWEGVLVGIEHAGWRDYPPGEIGPALLSSARHDYNLLTNPTLDWGTTAPTGWTGTGTGSEAVSYDPIGSGENSVLVMGTSSAYRYLYQTVSGLTNGINYHVKVRLHTGTRPELMRVGYGGVSDTTPTFFVQPTEANAWQTIEFDVAAAGGGFRVFIGAGGATPSETEYGVFDYVLVTRYYGTERSVDAKAAAPLVANQDLPWNITHIFNYDSSLTSYASLLDAALPITPWPTTTIGQNDAIYFGCTEGPFSTIGLIISQACAATLSAESFIWENWTGSGWSELPNVFDGSAGTAPGSPEEYYLPFSNAEAGGRAITFQAFGAWATTSINSVTAYWVRLRCTATSVVQTTAAQWGIVPWGVTKPYVEFTADQIGGDIPALVKLAAVNQGSWTGRNLMLSPLNAADDCYDDGSTLTYFGSGHKLGHDGTNPLDAALRFPSVPIPKGADISSVQLEFLPDNSYSNTTCLITISCEDADDPDDFMLDDSAAFAARTRGSDTANKTIGAWLGGIPTFITTALEPMIEAQVNRAGWKAGNAIVMFLDDNGSTSNAVRGWHSVGTTSYAPRLSVSYRYQGMTSTIVVAAARSVDRGAQFTPYLYCSQSQENGIEFRAREGTFFVAETSRPRGEYLEFEAGDMGTAGGGADEWADRGTWTLKGGTAQQYSGEFHAWFISAKKNTADSQDFNVRLRVASGSGGVSYSTQAAVSAADYYGISVGRIVIPEIAAWDEVEIGLQINTISTYELKCQGIVLMPVDEWAAEVDDVSGKITGPAYFDESVVMDSATLPRRQLWAPVLDTNGRQKNTMRVISPGRAQLEAQRRVRVFFFVQTDPQTYFADWHLYPEFTEVLLTTFHHLSHRVAVYPLQRYFSMRGDS